MSYTRTLSETSVNGWSNKIRHLKELLRSTIDSSTLNEQLNTLQARIGRYHQNGYEYSQINRLLDEYATVIKQKCFWQDKLQTLRYEAALLNFDSYQRIDSKISTLIDRIGLYESNSEFETNVIQESIDSITSDIERISARQKHNAKLSSTIPQHSDTSSFSFLSFFCCLSAKQEEPTAIRQQSSPDTDYSKR